MIKFQRNWKLVYTLPIVKEDGTLDKQNAEQITIKYPLKVEFDINRDTFAQSNRGTLKIYNLGLSTRNKIFQDRYNINRFCFVDFYAGYDDNMPLILTGKVLEAYSEKQGNDIVTTIEVMDNDIVQSYSSRTFEAGTPKKEVLNALVSDLPNVELGATGTLEGNIPNRLVVDDLTFVAINKLTGGHSFIDMNKINTLQNNEVLGDVSIYKINSNSGLLGTPRRKDAQLEIDCIFSPEITVGQLIEVESSTAPAQFNGQYKVIGLRHSGIISGAECGIANTTLNLFVGAVLPSSNYVWSNAFNDELSSVKGDKITAVVEVNASTIRDVYNYLVKNKKPPHTKITKNIWWDEVLMNYSKQGSTPSIDILSNLYAVATQLQTFVDRFYPNNKIIITSGWRSARYNASIPGAASNSRHIEGRALDFYLPGQINYYVGNTLQKVWNGWTRIYSSWLHADTSSTVTKGVANDR